MKPKTKKILGFLLSFLIAVTITLYFTWAHAFSYYLTDIQKSKYLDAKPTHKTIKNKKIINDSYLNDLGLIKANIQIPSIKNVEAGEYAIRIEYETHYLTISPWENIKGKEEIQFKKLYDVYNTTPEDINIFNKKGKNLTIIMNLILKSISLTSNTIEIINTGDLNIISQIYINSQGTKKRMVNVFDNQNIFSQSFILSSKLNHNDLEQQYIKFINSISYSKVQSNFEKNGAELIKEVKKNQE